MRTARFHRQQSGQTLVIVALMILVLLGFTGIVTDVAWYEVSLMRIQRAADAADVTNGQFGGVSVFRQMTLMP